MNFTLTVPLTFTKIFVKRKEKVYKLGTRIVTSDVLCPCLTREDCTNDENKCTTSCR